MKSNERLTIAAGHLDRILGFFTRVDSKASAIFAINSGLIAILCLNLKATDIYIWYSMVPAILALAILFASQFFIYRCTFPSLEGGHSSLIYFREIAKKTESRFIEEFVESEAESLTKDLLGQVWRNSEILKLKFGSLRTAFVLTGLALLPWTVFLIVASLLHGSIPSFR